MADIFEDVIGRGGDERDALEMEASHTREKYRNIGYKQGLFESRQSSVQKGFDAGFHTGAMQGFCETFLDGITSELRPNLTMEDYCNEPNEVIPQALEDTRQYIETMIRSTIE